MFYRRMSKQVMGISDGTLISLSKFLHIRGKRVRERTGEREMKMEKEGEKERGLIRNRH